jgi:catechol 2,3-dioxygenase-like lactoylglutathione lyase family enzyme
VVPVIPAVTGISHLAVNTPDLDRFRRFHEGLVGLPVGVVLRMTHPPYLRHATFHLDDVAVLHVFEVPGYDPQAQGFGTDIGERGRIDHFGLMVPDQDSLACLASRLRDAGASDGEVRSLGPVLSVHVTDPDGLQLEINCPDPDFDPAASGEGVEELGMPGWVERMRQAVTARRP